MDFAQTFDKLSVTHLEEYISRQQEENLYLDFKLIGEAAMSSANDKRNLARALSGFANSSGGLIVWGVDARKNSDGVDCAVALKEIDRVAMLLARLNSLTGDAVDPIVPGVRHRSIVTAGGKGFGVTLVPESDSGPHMAKLGEDRYFKRSGDSFYKMEHFDIADMFARRRKPKLIITVSVIGHGAGSEIIVGLRNDGRATARAPYLAIGCNPPFRRSGYGLDGNKNEGMPLLRFASKGFSWCYGEGLDFAIHPGVEHQIAKLYLGLDAKELPATDITIRYAIACDDQPLREDQWIVPLKDVQ